MSKQLKYNLLLSSEIIMLLFCLAFNLPFLMYFINLAAIITIIARSKFSLFSIKCFIAFYILVPLFAKEYFNFGSGILMFTQLEMQPVMINIIIFLYLAINLFFINNSTILAKEKTIYKKMESYSNAPVVLFFVLAIIAIVAYYPPAFLKGGNTDRFYHLIPGNFWNHFCVILLLFTLPSLNKKNLYVYLPWLFVIAWCFLKHERVDAIGLTLVLLFWHIHKGYISKRMFLFLTIIIVVLLSVMGFTRVGWNMGGLRTMLLNVIVQTTSSDICYILNSAIVYVSEYGYLGGQTYLSYIGELIPFISLAQDASTILQETYGHPGGIHLLAEPFMNFGVLGVAFYSLIECSFLYFVFSRKSRVKCIYYFYFVAASFRYCWYGISYLETGVVILIPFICILSNTFSKRKKQVVFNNLSDKAIKAN